MVILVHFAASFDNDCDGIKAKPAVNTATLSAVATPWHQQSTAGMKHAHFQNQATYKTF